MEGSSGSVKGGRSGVPTGGPIVYFVYDSTVEAQGITHCSPHDYNKVPSLVHTIPPRGKAPTAGPRKDAAMTAMASAAHTSPASTTTYGCACRHVCMHMCVRC